jgi:CheY-like chemotaxis protein
MACSVLVVDDDPQVRDFIELALADRGHTVLQAEHGGAALALLDSMTPDVILLDMRMPVVDGWEFARRYGARAGCKAPIVVMTAAVDAANRAAEIHAPDFLAKPFDLTALYECVAQYTPSA